MLEEFGLSDNTGNLHFIMLSTSKTFSHTLRLATVLLKPQ